MHNDNIRGFMNKMLYEEVIPTLPLDKADLEHFAAAVEDRFNNPFVDHELMSISLNSTSKWKARNMPSFLEYIDKQGKLPVCLTMSLAAYIAFYSNDVQELTDKGLVCKRPKGNTYTCSGRPLGARVLLEPQGRQRSRSGACGAHQRADVGSGPDQDRRRGSCGAC